MLERPAVEHTKHKDKLDVSQKTQPRNSELEQASSQRQFEKGKTQVLYVLLIACQIKKRMRRAVFLKGRKIPSMNKSSTTSHHSTFINYLSIVFIAFSSCSIDV